MRQGIRTQNKEGMKKGKEKEKENRKNQQQIQKTKRGGENR